VVYIVDTLVKRNIRFVAIKETIRFEGKQTMQTKVMVALFGLFAEVERDLISERTREGLIAARLRESFSAAQEVHWVDQSSMVKNWRSRRFWIRRCRRHRLLKLWGSLEPPFTISSAREALINT
jgi:hypothetical protein